MDTASIVMAYMYYYHTIIEHLILICQRGQSLGSPCLPISCFSIHGGVAHREAEIDRPLGREGARAGCRGACGRGART
jgi:hypothetical protein